MPVSNKQYLVKHIAIPVKGFGIHICPHGSDHLMPVGEGTGEGAGEGELVHPDVIGQHDVPIVSDLPKRQDEHWAFDCRVELLGIDQLPMRKMHQYTCIL